MLTLLVLFGSFLIIAFAAAVIMGTAAVLPAVLLVIALPLIDIFVIKLIFGKKNKKKKE